MTKTFTTSASKKSRVPINNWTLQLLEAEAATALAVEQTLANASVGKIVALSRRMEALSFFSAHTRDLAVIEVTLWDGGCDNFAEVLMDR